MTQEMVQGALPELEEALVLLLAALLMKVPG